MPIITLDVENITPFLYDMSHMDNKRYGKIKVHRSFDKEQGQDICPECGKKYKACYMCHLGHSHQKCVDDGMCHECQMKGKGTP